MDIKTNEKGQAEVQLKDGINIENKVVKRGYLKGDEASQLIMMYVITQLIDGEKDVSGEKVIESKKMTIWEKWEKSGIITPQQKKNLKMANTYLKKFVNDVFANNLDVKQKDTIVNRVKKYKITVVDDYTYDKVVSMIKKADKFYLTKDEFFDTIDMIMVNNCLNCKRNRNECAIHTFFCNKYVPPFDPEAEHDTCEYRYDVVPLSMEKKEGGE